MNTITSLFKQGHQITFLSRTIVENMYLSTVCAILIKWAKVAEIRNVIPNTKNKSHKIT
jgi:hypothetical protein